ncbi:hypothetical protein GCM10007907_24870 [Chitinimonas prasina]|uniref:Uncharacterized protein n=1 Tax=Chitinimonas prasina TaxID=1434937 RepID=A0ABQ5YFC8_9NEIS|nr:hypothetical protein [Chitinimonas prasina]GLR13697.1 hypothetical protein GCM10007907_24870 [Chitinimonas prasina]
MRAPSHELFGFQVSLTDSELDLPPGVTVAMLHSARALSVQLDISVQAALDAISEVLQEAA